MRIHTPLYIATVVLGRTIGVEEPQEDPNCHMGEGLGEVMICRFRGENNSATVCVE